MPEGSYTEITKDEGASDADRALTTLYSKHYGWLVSLAALLMPDVAAAEQVVQDSFVAMISARNRPQRGDHALGYLLVRAAASRSSAPARRSPVGSPSDS